MNKEILNAFKKVVRLDVILKIKNQTSRLFNKQDYISKNDIEKIINGFLNEEMSKEN